MMNERGKSYGLVVPEKPSNKAGRPVAEGVKGRRPAKGNTLEGSAYRTQGRVSASSAFERVRQAAGRDRRQRFTALFHHVCEVEPAMAALRDVEHVRHGCRLVA
jgi:hypothetical protein